MKSSVQGALLGEIRWSTRIEELGAALVVKWIYDERSRAEIAARLAPDRLGSTTRTTATTTALLQRVDDCVASVIIGDLDGSVLNFVYDRERYIPIDLERRPCH